MVDLCRWYCYRSTLPLLQCLFPMLLHLKLMAADAVAVDVAVAMAMAAVVTVIVIASAVVAA